VASRVPLLAAVAHRSGSLTCGCDVAAHEVGDRTGTCADLGRQQLHVRAGLCGDQPIGSGPWPNGNPRIRDPLAEEGDHRSQAGVAIFGPNRLRIDHHVLRGAENHRLVKSGGVVIEECQRAFDAVYDGRGEFAVAGQAVNDRLGRDSQSVSPGAREAGA
jgi:hypothetical protein